MAASSRKALGRRLGVLVAGAVVATSLTAASAVAATSAPIGMQATGPTRPGADASPDRRAGTPPPGFLLERGRFKPVAPPPGQEDILSLSTAPTDLNDRDQIVGAYDSVAADATRGFLLERGRFATVHVPEAKSTQVQGINNRGQIVGKYSNTSNAVSENGSLIRGFLLDRGRYVRLDFPGAVTSQAFDINDRGQVVGEYQDADGRFHGYLWQRGRFRTIDVPSQPGTTTAIGRLLRLAVAGAVVTALTAAAAAAAPPTRTGDAASMGVQADGLSRLGAGDSGSGTGLRSPFPAFLLDRGRYTAFEAPRPGVELYPLGINNRGQISGEYVRVGDDGIPDSESGFVRDQRGRTTVLDVPGAKGTEAVKVNDRGQVVGTFSTDTPIVNNAASFHGYLWDRGKVTRIDAPGAVGTTALGVNNRAQVVGAYWDSTGTAHGYLWERGRFTTIGVPGAVITQPLDINDRGQVIGYYLDDLTSQPGTIHGYLWDRGRLATIAAHDGPFTLPSDINNRGQIVGQLRTDVTVSPADDPGTRGFLLAKGVKGPFTPVSFPGAPRSIANGINDRGQIVGNYQNPNATPSRQRTGAPPPRGMEETPS